MNDIVLLTKELCTMKMRPFVACFCKSPANPREAHEMNFILQRSTGTQMVGKMLRASILHNPDETKIRLGLKTQITS